MLAAMFYAPLDVRIEERPLPRPSAGEIVVQIATATTCGTDVKAYRRGHPMLFRQTPAPFGHEMAGVVAATGGGVTACVEGDAVVVANSAPCLNCFYCKRQRYSLCENLLLLNGAYAEYMLVPERIVRQNVHTLSPSTSFVAAAMTEPLACALHGIDASDIHPGDTVVILGTGPLGLLLIAAASRQGARVIATGRGAQRLSLARFYGADAVIDAGSLSLDEQRAEILKHTEDGRGADVAIEAIGTPETWALAAQLTRAGGLVNFFGGCVSGTAVTLATFPIHYQELTLKGVFHHTPRYFAQALELIQGGLIDVEALVTERLPLSKAVDALDMLLHKQGVKYALIPPAFAPALLPAADLQ